MRLFISLIFLITSLFIAYHILKRFQDGHNFSLGDLIGLLGVSITITLAFIINPLTPLSAPSETIDPTNTSIPTEKGSSPSAELPRLTATIAVFQAVTSIPSNRPVTKSPTPDISTKTVIIHPINTPSIPTLLKTITPTQSSTNTTQPIPTNAHPNSRARDALTPTTNSIANITLLRIQANGRGLVAPTATNLPMRERSALLAAELDAKRKLAEWSEGAEIESVTIVEQGIVSTDTIRQTIKAKIPGATVIDERYDDSSGVANITLEIILEEQ